MARPTEQLEDASDDFFAKLVAALQEMKDVREGKVQLPTYEVTNGEQPQDEIRQIVASLFTK
jgi:hypothetical protein